MTETWGEPLARYGFWRVGGPMDHFVVPDTLDQLRGALDGTGPRWVLGNGSNLLAPDHGLRGTTVRLGQGFRTVESLPEDRVRVGAGLLNTVLLARLGRLGLSGLGCLAGVPGSVGGAVVMNAGTTLGEIGDRLVAVEGVHRGDLVRRERGELPMRYREGGLPEGFVVTHATFQLGRDPGEAARIAEHLARRRATQPLDLPSCGSVFRNPPGDHAGRLIEAVGLKGHRIGGAEISARHGNFIVNVGNASAADVMGCIRIAWERVRDGQGVVLVPEVRVLGAWADWPLDAASNGPAGAAAPPVSG